MEAAKQAIREFTSNSGHRTDVEEKINPAVTSETVRPTRHEESTQAIDREVHQHHYHTTVQPITHQEVLPEQHSHQMMPIENREFHHGDHDAVKRGVSAEIGQFANTSVTHQTQHTQSAAPTVTGEHVHHHVHETVQPVIHKETIQPEVVHTTVPIHEVHHKEATHHGMSALPMKTLAEFTTAGGILHGSERSTHEEYDGAPRPYNKNLQTTVDKVLHPLSGGSGTHHLGSGTHHLGSGTTDTTGSHHLGSGTGTHHLGSGNTGHTGLTGTGHHNDGLTGTGHHMTSPTTTTTTTTNTNTTMSSGLLGKGHAKRDSGIGDRDTTTAI